MNKVFWVVIVIVLFYLSGINSATASQVSLTFKGTNLDYMDHVAGTYVHISDDEEIFVSLTFDNTYSYYSTHSRTNPQNKIEYYCLTNFGEAQITTSYDFSNLPVNPFNYVSRYEKYSRFEEYYDEAPLTYATLQAFFYNSISAADNNLLYEKYTMINGYDWDGGDGFLNVKTAEDFLLQINKMVEDGDTFNFQIGSSLWDPNSKSTIEYSEYVLYDLKVVPIPGALWLFGSGLAGLVALRRRKK